MKTPEANNKKLIWQDTQKKDKTFKGTWKDYENVRKPVEMKRNEKHVRTCMGKGEKHVMNQLTAGPSVPIFKKNLKIQNELTAN